MSYGLFFGAFIKNAVDNALLNRQVFLLSIKIYERIIDKSPLIDRNSGYQYLVLSYETLLF
ncbi:hypothetical protein GCM10007161_18430 [Ignatzschineria indica]|nr:hypothetical protein GCM10007161_18430 [Ignatzschineria indica]